MKEFANELDLINYLDNHINKTLNLDFNVYLKGRNSEFYSIKNGIDFYADPISYENEVGWTFHSTLGWNFLRDDLFPLELVSYEEVYDNIRRQ
jgi:hypothetical protein